MHKKIIKNRIKKERSGNRAFLFCTPEHNNLGDHAIAIAQQKYLSDNLTDFSVIEITGNDIKNAIRYIKKVVTSDDLLIITGGGLMGDVWMEEENNVLAVIEGFPQNQIIILPETIFFSDENEEMNRLISSVKKCKDISVCCREKNSYGFSLNHLTENTYCVPDMAFYLDEYVDKTLVVERKNNIGLCFRSDAEKLKKCESIADFISSQYGSDYCIEEFSTIYQNHISPEERNSIVMDFLKNIQKYRLVVTDRLHAMVFCYITNTPCIAIDNKTHKVSGVFELIKDCNYIKLYNNDIDDLLKQLLSIEEINKPDINKQFEELNTVISQID